MHSFALNTLRTSFFNIEKSLKYLTMNTRSRNCKVNQPRAKDRNSIIKNLVRYRFQFSTTEFSFCKMIRISYFHSSPNLPWNQSFYNASNK